MSPTPPVPYLLPTVLIVEPRRSRRNALLRLLGRPDARRLTHPLSFIQAGTLADGLRQIEIHRPVLILVNPQLPDGEPEDVLTALRAAAPHSPLLLLSDARHDADIDAQLSYDRMTSGRLVDAIQRFLQPPMPVEPESASPGAVDPSRRSDGHASRPILEPEQRHQIFGRLASLTNAASSESTLLEEATRLIGDVVNADDFGLLLYDPGTELLRVDDTYRSNEGADRLTLVPIHAGVVGRAVRERRTLYIPDATQDPDYLHYSHLRGSEIAAPLIHDQQVLGVLNVESSRKRAFSESDITLLQAIADQLAVAIGNIRLREKERYQLREATALREASAALTSRLELSDIFELIFVYLDELVTCDSAAILLLCSGVFEPVALHRLPDPERAWETRLPLDSPLCARIDQTRQGVLLENAAADPDFLETPSSGGIGGWMGVPLIARDQIIGLLTVDRYELGGFSREHLQTVQTLANHAAIAIDNAHLYATEKKKRDMAEALRKIQQRLVAITEMDVLLEALLDAAAELIPYDAANVMLVDDDDVIRVKTLRGYEQWTEAALIKEVRFDLAEHPSMARVFLQKECLLISDTRQDPLWQMAPGTEFIRSWLGLPLTLHDITVGCIGLDATNPHAFGPEHLALAEALAAQASSALQNVQLLTVAQRTADDQQLTVDILHQLNATMNIREVLPRITTHLRALTRGQRLGLVLLDEQKQQSKVIYVEEDGRVRSPTKEHVIHSPPGTPDALSDELVLLSDLAQLDRLPPGVEALRQRGFRSWASLPLLVHGDVVGWIEVGWREPAGYTSTSLSMLQQVASAMGLALARAEVFRREQRRLAELELVADISAGVREATTLHEMIPVILLTGLRVVDGTQGSIMLLCENGTEVEIRGVYPPHAHAVGHRLKADGGLTGRVLRSGQPYVAHDFQLEDLPHFHPTHPDGGTEHQALRTTFSAPLRTPERTLGVMHLGLNRIHEFTALEHRLLQLILEIASAAIDRAQFHETLEQRVAIRTHELQVANERLQELDRLKSKFVADVSHEFRTPLTSLSLYLDLLQRGQEARREMYLERLEQQVQRLSTLVEDVLSLARLDLGHGEMIRRRPVDLNQLVRDAVATFDPHSSESAVTIQTRLHPDLPPIHAEPGQVSQAISNLLNNALLYAGGSQIEIDTGLSEDGNQVFLTVSDDGVGIPAAETALLFDRFYRGERAAQSTTPGTGLGLAIVKEIVELHGGTIDVESPPGAGATFRLAFPRPANA